MAASWAPVTAGAATVGCALATLMVCALPGHRNLAPAGAVAMGCCALAALTLVPAATLLANRPSRLPRRRLRPLHMLRTRLTPLRVVDRTRG
ncbi:MMPL family transporter [Streptomyces sp. NPDC046979]|uniref:MMPL family transporter n=1 Tax=Streptomyces sp. NPDC046979 TaxID=3154604 RepID=UPI0033E7665A